MSKCHERLAQNKIAEKKKITEMVLYCTVVVKGQCHKIFLPFFDSADNVSESR